MPFWSIPPLNVKLQYAALKSTYDSLSFAKLILSTYSREVFAMSFQDFDDAIKSFNQNEDIEKLRNDVYE